MKYFDALLPIGRTNGAVRESPVSEKEALAVMDRFSVAEALVFHTVSRDADPGMGNSEIEKTASSRLHRIFAFDPAYTAQQTPLSFLESAVARRAKAIMFNPAFTETDLSSSPRLIELAGLLEDRSMPLIVAYRANIGAGSGLEWDSLTQLCNQFPNLPVLVWEHRIRRNRPLLDAMGLTQNLIPILSSLWQSQMTECIVEHFGAERLVFSLGLPGLHAASFPAVLSYAHISDEDKEKVATGNLRRLMKGTAS